MLAVVKLMLLHFSFSQNRPVTFRIQELLVFGCTVLPDSKETTLINSNQEASSADKRTVVVLVPCHIWKCVIAIFGGVDIS